MLKLAVDNEFNQTDLVKAWCRKLMIKDGLKKNTIYNREKIIRKAIRAYGTQQPDHEQVEDYIAAMYSAEYSYAHITNTIRAHLGYMAFIGNAIDIGYPRKPKQTIKEPLTEGEVAIIIEAARPTRERAMIALLAYSGCRNEELCNTRVKDVDFGANIMHVELGKGSKSRNIPISGECTKLLLQYLADYPRDENAFLFTTLHKNDQYKPHSLRRVVNTVAKRTSIKKRVYPHLFRHSLANNMLQRGASIVTIKGQLGHNHLETTMIYIHSNEKMLIHEYHKHAPSYT